jgi:hypothetical protein
MLMIVGMGVMIVVVVAHSLGYFHSGVRVSDRWRRNGSHKQHRCQEKARRIPRLPSHRHRVQSSSRSRGNYTRPTRLRESAEFHIGSVS